MSITVGAASVYRRHPTKAATTATSISFMVDGSNLASVQQPVARYIPLLLEKRIRLKVRVGMLGWTR